MANPNGLGNQQFARIRSKPIALLSMFIVTLGEQQDFT